MSGVFVGIRNVLMLYALLALAWLLLACAEPPVPAPVAELPPSCDPPYYRLTLHGCEPVPMWEVGQ